MLRTTGISQPNIGPSREDIEAMVTDFQTAMPPTRQVIGRAAIQIPLRNHVTLEIDDPDMLHNDKNRLRAEKNDLRNALPSPVGNPRAVQGEQLGRIAEQPSSRLPVLAHAEGRNRASCLDDCSCPSLPSCPTLSPVTRSYLYTTIALAGTTTLGLGGYMAYSHL